eukprot:TRINITY_DN171_c2_g2_i1.p1 TRINITY_DN171_c2_g2~~TRINITY_DN171_c2_g2_i1.p1  ORF type:complete len:102 (+),score=17.22 TRINITY_DN171_c2_g2_i1:264-569(+)
MDQERVNLQDYLKVYVHPHPTRGRLYKEVQAFNLALAKLVSSLDIHVGFSAGQACFLVPPGENQTEIKEKLLGVGILHTGKATHKFTATPLQELAPTRYQF